MDDIEFTFASNEEKIIKKLLFDCNLPFDDITSYLDHFILAKYGDDLIGIIGLEVYGEISLLRSLAVRGDYRNRGIGNNLYLRLFNYSKSINIKELYLLTTTAEKFFSNLGFKRIDRDNVPVKIKNTNEFKVFCPSTAICMRKNVIK